MSKPFRIAVCMTALAALCAGPARADEGLPDIAPAVKSGQLAKRSGGDSKVSLQQARALYDAGKLDEAQAMYEQIVKEDPVDTESRRYLKSILSIKRKMAARDQNIIENDRILDVRKAWLPLESDAKNEEQVQADAASRQKWMDSRLRQIIPEVNFTDAKLRDVIAYLSKLSGVNMILDEDVSGSAQSVIEEVEPGQEGAAAEGGAGSGPVSAALSSGVTIALKNVPLIDVLQYILAPQGLTYRIDEYALVISTPQRLDQGDMETRSYHLSSGIGTFIAVQQGKEPAAVDDFAEEPDANAQSTLTIKDVLEESGVPFPPGSKIFLDARTGTLIVRNTPGNLAIVEKILGALDVPPFQVAIESKFVDIAETTAREMGLEIFLTGNFPLKFTSGPNQVISSQAGSSTAGQFTSSTVSREGVTRGLRFLTDSSGNPKGNIFSFASVLTQPQFQVVLHALDQSGMANILSAPKVTTVNNQQAKIQVVTEIFYPTQFEITPATTNDSGTIVTPPVVIPGGFTSRDVGIVLEVTPSVGADRKTINLTLIPEVSTLSGWQDFGISVGANFPATPILQPVFTSKNVTASIVINDTETVVLGGLIKDDTTTQDDKIPVLGDIPFFGNAFRSNTVSSVKKNLLIFVTAYLLSPNGETVNPSPYKKTKIFNP